MSPRVVVAASWWVDGEHDPSKRSVAFVIVDDVGAVTWGEQVRRIADLVPHQARWDVIPVPTDVSERRAFQRVAS